MAITIKKIGSDTELKETAQLADIIWHECFTGIISEGQIDYMVEKFQSYKAMTKQLIDQDYSYFAVRDDGELCGYIGVRPEKDSRFFLSKLYLRKDKRGSGIASQMLEKVFEESLFTAMANLTGVPALVSGGVQLMGDHFSESTLLSLAKSAEKEGK